MNESIKSIVRHGLSFGGGFLVAKGLVSVDQANELAGAVVRLEEQENPSDSSRCSRRVNWIYQLVRAFLDFIREAPAPKIVDGNAPKDLKDNLHGRIAGLHGLPKDSGDSGARR